MFRYLVFKEQRAALTAAIAILPHPPLSYQELLFW
jgi:hypothetical protein